MTSVPLSLCLSRDWLSILLGRQKGAYIFICFLLLWRKNLCLKLLDLNADLIYVWVPGPPWAQLHHLWNRCNTKKVTWSLMIWNPWIIYIYICNLSSFSGALEDSGMVEQINTWISVKKKKKKILVYRSFYNLSSFTLLTGKNWLVLESNLPILSMFVSMMSVILVNGHLEAPVLKIDWFYLVLVQFETRQGEGRYQIHSDICVLWKLVHVSVRS